jgi:tRNA (guanine-N7-)-methyltransferase
MPRASPVPRPAHLGPGCRVEVELGCADAQFGLELARAHPDWFVVGLDIREPLLARNRRRAQALGLANVAFGYVNLNADLDRVFGQASVDRFHLLFPDPWFKARHRKRRVFDRDLCALLRRQLRPDGELHLASDMFDVVLEMMAELEHPRNEALGFINMAGPWSFWRGNPFEVHSRRELTTSGRGQPVWRLRYFVRDAPVWRTAALGPRAAAGTAASAKS